jgi:hypothetical protein
MGNGQGLASRAGRIALVVVTFAAMLLTAGAQVDTGSPDDAYPLLFPVVGDNNWTDTWGAPRSGGRTHEGTDIFAEKGTPVVAAADGVISRIAIGGRAGRYIKITHDDGWSTFYMHLNNDTPGTDDGLLDETVEGMAVGVRVSAGDVIDFVGDSGNAEDTPPHVHFELHLPDDTPINPAPHLYTAVTGEPIDTAIAAPAVAKPAYDAVGTELVGRLDPGGGFTAGLAVNNEIAYMGTWGRPDLCPNTGVRVIDASDPTEPVLVGTLAGADEFPGTSTDGVWAGSIDTDAFTGDIAVVSVRLCDTSELSRIRNDFRGMAIYDVTDPASPVLLGTYDSGERTQGVNDVTAAVRPDGTVVVSATVMQSYRHTEGELGDWRLIDITDPTAPVQLADWDYRATLPDDDPAKRDINLHSHTTTIAPDGMSVWVAVWDAGMVMLDLNYPRDPEVVAHVAVAAGTDGNAHSIAFDPESGLLIRNDEDLDWTPEGEAAAAWGGQTIYDASDLGAISEVGAFATERSDLSDGEPMGVGYLSAHEVILDRDVEYLSWYSDGLRIVDVSDPEAPVEVGSFVPAPAADPAGHFQGQGRGKQFAMVWGVKVDEGLIYLSDMNSGLWIVRLEQHNPEGAGAAL